MIAERLRRHLEGKHIAYTHHVHRTTYTAQEVVAEEHVPGRMMAKTLIVHTGEGFVLAVLPAPSRLDLGALRAALGKPQARLATEAEFAGLFPDSEVGAMPPFGNLYGLPVYVDAALVRYEEIVFNAGTHQDTIRLRYQEFSRLVQPKVLALALEHASS